jgi:hypothetical protein
MSSCSSLLAVLVLCGGATPCWMASGTPSMVPVGVPVGGFQGCPIPVGVTLTFLSSQPATGTRPGRNIWDVHWNSIGQLPAGISSFFSFKVTVSDQLGSATSTASGSERSAKVAVEHTRSTPLTSLTPFATVEGIADTRSCDNEVIFATNGGVNGVPSSPCLVPVSFPRNPTVMQVFKPINGIKSPDGWAVKIDWRLAHQPVHCLTIKEFHLKVTVSFRDGSRNVVTETASGDARSRTIKVSNSPLAQNEPQIYEVTLRAITELNVFGSSSH